MRPAARHTSRAGSGGQRRLRHTPATPDDRRAAVMVATHLIGFLVGIYHTGMNEVAEVLRRWRPPILLRDLVVDLAAGGGGIEGAAEDEIGDALARCPADRLRAQDAGRPDRRGRLLQRQLPWVDDAQVIVVALPTEGARH